MGDWRRIEMLCPRCNEWLPTEMASKEEQFESDEPLFGGQVAFMLPCDHAVSADDYMARLGEEVVVGMAEATDDLAGQAERWRGVGGGTVPSLWAGAHVVDAATGASGQIERVLADGSGLVRMEDGRVLRTGRRSPLAAKGPV